MQITGITPSFTGRTLIINPKDNKHVKYFYNNVIDIISHPDHRLPATVSVEDIRIDGATDYPRNLNIVAAKLKEAGIKFIDKISK